MRVWHCAVSSLVALSLSCGSDNTSPDATAIAKVGDTTAFGVVWSLTFDASDNPLIGTQNGVHRFDGNVWVALPEILTKEVAELVVGRAGDLYALSNSIVLRLKPGASAWEILAEGQLKYGRLVEASDGILYALQDRGPLSSTMRVVFRGPDDSTWTDSNVDVSVFCYPIKDSSANIWCENSDTLDVQRINKTSVETFPQAYGFRPELGHVVKTVEVDASGTHWGMSYNYTGVYGEVWSWKPGAGPASKVIAGTSCEDNSETKFCAAPGNGFITSPTRGANGQYYGFWAQQNGYSPYLMTASSSGPWRVLFYSEKLFEDPGSPGYATGIDPATLQVKTDSKGRVYLWAVRLLPGQTFGKSIVMRGP